MAILSGDSFILMRYSGRASKGEEKFSGSKLSRAEIVLDELFSPTMCPLIIIFPLLPAGIFFKSQEFLKSLLGIGEDSSNKKLSGKLRVSSAFLSVRISLFSYKTVKENESPEEIVCGPRNSSLIFWPENFFFELNAKNPATVDPAKISKRMKKPISHFFQIAILSLFSKVEK